MSLIVEDGTGLSTANSYISVADADAYFEARSNSTWDGAIDDSKEAALLYATLWVDRRYVWPGFIVISTQALSWPRGWAYDYEGRVIDSSTVPQAVKDAVCEAALEHLSTSLNEILARGGERLRRDDDEPRPDVPSINPQRRVQERRFLRIIDGAIPRRVTPRLEVGVGVRDRNVRVRGR
jgi:hypothetical protein